MIPMPTIVQVVTMALTLIWISTSLGTDIVSLITFKGCEYAINNVDDNSPLSRLQIGSERLYKGMQFRKYKHSVGLCLILYCFI